VGIAGVRDDNMQWRIIGFISRLFLITYGVHLKSLLLLLAALLVFGLRIAVGQTAPQLSDEQAREIAGAAIYTVHPEPCYSTYRDERLESIAFDLRRNRIVDNHLNNSVYFYSVASDVCEYVVERDGKPVLMTQVSSDCCEYGLVAVDRVTSKSYWFAGDNKAQIFGDFVRDERLQPDSTEPRLFFALYRNLAWGNYPGHEIESLEQLRSVIQENFHSAYSPYERDDIWQKKFGAWWRKFQSKMPQLKLETTYESTGEGIRVHGFSFSGFQLTIPRSDPPPKGTPTVSQWTLLVKADGTVEPQPTKILYSAH
jgi:hypothetical protein